MRALHKPHLLSGRTQLLHNDPMDRFTGCLEHLLPLPHWPWYSFCCIFFHSASTVLSALNAYPEVPSSWLLGSRVQWSLEAGCNQHRASPHKGHPYQKPWYLHPMQCTLLKDRKPFTANTPQKKTCSSVSFWLLQKRSSSPGEAKLTWHMTKQQPHKFPKKPCVNNVWVCLFHLEKI